MKNYIILILSFIGFCSCSSKDKEKIDNKSTAKNELIPFAGKEFYLTLDNVTPVFNFYCQPVMIDNEMKILWYNRENNSLDFYDLTSKAIDTRLQFQLNGPNALPGMEFGAGINFVNSDSILLFSKQLKRIYLTNMSGEVYSKVNISNHGYGFGSISFESPIAYRKGHVYLPILPDISIDAPAFFSPDYNRIAKVDLISGELEEFIIEPPIEFEGVQISHQLRMMNIVYNSKIDKFIISFPLSDKIIVTDFEDYKKEYIAKSSLIKDVVMLDPDKKDIASSSLVNYFYWINSSYERLIYDPINDLYFREARKGISEEAFKQRNFSEEREILVLNSDFEQIAAFSFNGGGTYYYFFAKDYFFWNKDISKFNLDNGVEDTIFFQGKELIF